MKNIVKKTVAGFLILIVMLSPMVLGLLLADLPIFNWAFSQWD